MPLITDQMMYSNIRDTLMQGQVRVSDAQQRVSTGLRVAQASDDPAAAGQGLLLGSSLNYLEGMKSASDRIHVNLETLTADLQDTQNALTRAKALVTQANNGSLSAEDRQGIGAEMASLQQVVLAIANKQDESGKYLYSGYLTDTQPFDAAGTYAGDSNARQVEVAPNLRVRSNVPGDQIFNVSGGTNVLGALANVVTALNADDRAGIEVGIEQIDDAVNQIAIAQAAAGGQELLLNGAQTTRQTAELATRKTRESVVEIDSIKAISDSVKAQAAYDQALASSAQILKMLQMTGR